MVNLKRTGTVRKTRKRNICSFLAVVYCTLVIASSIGTSLGIKNSYVQAQQQQQQQQQQLVPRQAPTVAYQSPWSNNLQISSAGSNSQPLFKAGTCS
jgi:CHASE2 domain-containing sensor protein